MRWSYEGLQDKDETLSHLVEKNRTGNSGRCSGMLYFRDREWSETLPSESARREVIAREERYLKRYPFNKGTVFNCTEERSREIHSQVRMWRSPYFTIRASLAEWSCCQQQQRKAGTKGLRMRKKKLSFTVLSLSCQGIMN